MNCLIITNGYGLADGILHQLKRLKEELTLRNISLKKWKVYLSL